MKKFVIGFFFVLNLVSVVSAQNIILNSSFELWLDSLGIRMPFGWYTSEAQDSGSAIRVIDPRSGVFALKLNGSDSVAYATTLSFCFAGRNYYFSGWCKTTSLIAGAFVINWLNRAQQPVADPVIVPIYRSTSYRQYTQILQAPDSAVLVNLNIVALSYISITVDDVTLTDTVLTGIEEQSSIPKSSLVKIFPNPGNEQIQIHSSEPNLSISVYDITGKQLKSDIEKSSNIIKLNTRQLTEGIYFIKVTTRDKTDIQKVIVRR